MFCTVCVCDGEARGQQAHNVRKVENLQVVAVAAARARFAKLFFSPASVHYARPSGVIFFARSALRGAATRDPRVSGRRRR